MAWQTPESVVTKQSTRTIFWRPITAIRFAASDGNPETVEDVAWTPLLITPPFPEYPSAHSCISGAAARVLAINFGANTVFSLDAEVSPGSRVMRHFNSFSAALEEVKNARIFGGIHFRFACGDGQTLGIAVADLVLSTALRRLHGQ